MVNIGPSLPSQEDRNASDSDNDDFIGPVAPSSSTSASQAAEALSSSSSGPSYAERQFIEREARLAAAAEENTGPSSQNAGGKPQRDEWMLAPPPGDSSLASLLAPSGGPMKARGFQQGSTRVQQGPGAAINSDAGDEDGMRMWTETPQQRAERLKGEVMGESSVSASKGRSDEQVRQAKATAQRRDEEMRQRVQVMDQSSNRGKSLLQQHQAKRREEYRQSKKGNAAEGEPAHRRSRSVSSASTSGSEDSEEERRKRRRAERSDAERDVHHSHRSDRHRDEHHRGHRHRDERRDRNRERERRRSRSRSPERKHSSHSSRRRHRSRSRSPDRDRDRDRRHRRHRDKDRDEDRERRRDREKGGKRSEDGGVQRSSTSSTPAALVPERGPVMWDRDKAMNVNSMTMDDRKRQATLLGAKSGLGDRFGGASSGSRFL